MNQPRYAIISLDFNTGAHSVDVVEGREDNLETARRLAYSYQQDFPTRTFAIMEENDNV